MDSTKINSLIDIAKKASDSNFCCKYSNFSVGAALMDKDGNVFTFRSSSTNFDVKFNFGQGRRASSLEFVSGLPQEFGEWTRK